MKKSNPVKTELKKTTLSTKSSNKKPSVSSKKLKKVSKPIISQDVKEKSDYRNEVRSIFLKAGFNRIPGVSDKEFNFLNKYKSDFDDVFAYENILVFCEYTLTKSSKISDHIKPKTLIYNSIFENESDFIDYYGTLFPTFIENRKSIYHNSQVKIVILYCAKNDVDSSIKEQINNIKYLDYPTLQYFKVVTEAVKLSSKYELLKFLGLEFKEIGQNIFNANTSPRKMNGTILPESHSNFPKGYKVLSFYVDPETLLTNSYVLRKDGWREEGGLYQRMIQKKKINSIRNYLLHEKRVFINNIIVTLPSETQTLDANKPSKIIDPKNLPNTIPVQILIPNEFNAIGLIDGQHRVFAYHEGGSNDDEIATLRKRQNLLVTGIIYPDAITDIERSKFEANLFLEINTNQTTAKSELKQAIGVLLNPYASESIAKAVIHRININGPLAGKIERHFYENDKIKPTSIVSYGLKPLVKLSGENSFFYIWDNAKKQNLLNKADDSLLKEYIDFCSSQINMFLNAVKESIGLENWTLRNENGILSTTSINGFIICLRKLVESNQLGDFPFYKTKLKNIKTVDFSSYKSSQYTRLAEELYNKCFNS